MKKTSLAEAKTHLSEFVNDVQYQHQRILILRHGKAAAALVPVGEVVSLTRGKKSKKWTNSRIERLLAPILDSGTSESAVADVLASRR